MPKEAMEKEEIMIPSVHSIVRVTSRTDNTMQLKYIGRLGIVRGYITDDCGSTKSDPMIVVLFSSGITDSFWSEELTTVKGDSNANG